MLTMSYFVYLKPLQGPRLRNKNQGEEVPARGSAGARGKSSSTLLPSFCGELAFLLVLKYKFKKTNK